MLKRTLVFSNPGHLSLKLDQLLYQPKSSESEPRTIPVEDIGFVLIETPQITLTAASLHFLAANNVAVVLCDEKHMPSATLASMDGHTTAQKQISAQLKATEALKDRLWQQTVKAKLENQAACLERGGLSGGKRIRALIPSVKKGDTGNSEAIAARLYFQTHFTDPATTRDRFGDMPNAALNYGYAILRAATARALIGSGLTCLVGIHHHNQYNAFVLADDIMEPYRPFVDDLVFNSPRTQFPQTEELTKELKAYLLSVLTVDVMLGTLRRPLMNALSCTTASLARCFLKEEKEIAYPRFPPCPVIEP